MSYVVPCAVQCDACCASCPRQCPRFACRAMAAQARGLLLLLCLLATLFLPGSAYGQVQASDFADIVKDDSSDVLVLFHRADSEQCMNFEPTFSQLEADSKVEGAVLSGVVFAAADVSEVV